MSNAPSAIRYTRFPLRVLRRGCIHHDKRILPYIPCGFKCFADRIAKSFPGKLFVRAQAKYENMLSTLEEYRSEVIDTHIYRVGLEQLQFGMASVVNIFKSALALVLLFIVNTATREMMDSGLF